MNDAQQPDDLPNEPQEIISGTPSTEGGAEQTSSGTPSTADDTATVAPVERTISSRRPPAPTAAADTDVEAALDEIAAATSAPVLAGAEAEGDEVLADAPSDTPVPLGSTDDIEPAAAAPVEAPVAEAPTPAAEVKAKPKAPAAEVELPFEASPAAAAEVVADAPLAAAPVEAPVAEAPASVETAAAAPVETPLVDVEPAAPIEAAAPVEAPAVDVEPVIGAAPVEVVPPAESAAAAPVEVVPPAESAAAAAVEAPAVEVEAAASVEAVTPAEAPVAAPVETAVAAAPVEPVAAAPAEAAAPVEAPTPVEAVAAAAATVETDDDVEQPNGFAELGLRPELLRALAGLGYEEPTPIQRETIVPILAGRDLLGQAATGTGKTAAFALPILQMLTGADGGAPVALVLVPTRELAVQVSEAMYKYGRDLDARVVPIYGGQPIFRQLQTLKQGVHVVVATPGRAVDHIKRGTLNLDSIRTVVLDEADEMLDMGFAEELEQILDATPAGRQTVLFSATLPPRINSITRKYLNDPVRIQIGKQSAESGAPPLVEQRAYIVPRSHKAAALGRVLDVEAPTASIVFCRTRGEVDTLTETLNGRGYRAEALHGGMSQEQRDKVMGRLRNSTAELLVATDVAARGLDIDQLTHVFNFDVPSAPESYVHRIGRVGRAGREGVAITFAEPREQRLLGNIERLTKQKISICKVPSIAALRARQLDIALDGLRAAVAEGGLDGFRTIVDTLSEEYPIEDIAAAAVKMAHEANGGTVDEVEIPDFTPRPQRDDYSNRDDRGSGDRGTGKKPPRLEGPITSIHFDVGRNAGIRPQDLVGAIANETRLSGREIGKISVTDRFSIVEVPQDAANEVIAAMSRTLIRGKKVAVRLDRKGSNSSGSYPKAKARWD